MEPVKVSDLGVKEPSRWLAAGISGVAIGVMTTTGYLLRGVAAPYALPVTFAAYLAVGTAAAALDGRLTATGVLIACAVVAGLVAFITEPAAAVLIAGIGWLTVVGFSRPPYAQLR